MEDRSWEWRIRVCVLVVSSSFEVVRDFMPL